ncbi:endogenous retrovirus group K member 6 Pol protein-like [Podarcis lilfordi]|uniref:RNA-directed DNA polymerase n=1 Tax=Podarcis lilfordi TaxID=74358 RepID=A0AA35LP88_9SAUR|nr:endogenous retrovirus group K member 6 Pol protein-like [Podarcis lilfordi]
MLLSPVQYVVFESEFKHSASALSDPQHTANQLYGTGQYDNIPAQATLTPLHFSRTATCVQRAFRKVPVSGQPLSSFVNIKQQHSEPYHQFIDRLKESVTRQIDNTTAQNELMKKLAFENANTDCKKALQSIIHRPKYDLADMIQACADVGSQSHAMSLLTIAIQANNKPTGQIESPPPLVSAAEKFSKYTPSDFTIELINQETKDTVLPGEIVLMPTQLAGPLAPKVAGLILPKFSAAKEGIQVIPGVLDPDYVGTIMVQLWSHMPMQLNKGESWAHLVVLLSHPTASIMDSNLHELSSFPPQLLAVVQRIGEKKLLRFITDGNAKADSLLRALPVSPIESHAFHHQNAKALSRQFQIPLEAARAIIQQCPQCSNQIGHPSPGVNPRGLAANQLWQMDVTHFAPFSPWKFIHVCLDTFSGFIWATPQRGEQVKHVCNHLVRTMSVMGKPHSLKTDNAPAYCAKTFAQFCETWNSHHLFGIPYNSQGQAIVERANRTLKTALIRQEKKAGVPASLSEKEGWLASVLFTLNHLNVSIQDHQSYTRLQKHFQQTEILPAPLVRYKILPSNEWSEPVKLITWGKGYAAISTPQGARWVPARCIRLYHGVATDPTGSDTAVRPQTTDRPGCGVQPPQDSQAGKS